MFFNLMSNAFKYTSDNGRIHMVCTCDDNRLVFSVEDTGQGIAVEDIGSIFDRFYQVDKIHPNGSGIGLSLAKAFVELHGGSIDVESVLGKGSKFTVSLPVRHVSTTADININRTISDADVNVELGDIELESDKDADGKPLLLIIDDNTDGLTGIHRRSAADRDHIVSA